MALKTVDLGPVSSYAIAVSKGYTGTEQEWYELIHNVTTEAQSAADSAASAAQDAAAAAQSLVDIGTAKTAAIGEIQDEGTTQKGLVTAEGTAQVGNVQDAKDLAVAAVQAQQGTSVQAVYDKGTEQVTAVGSEGTTQIGLVTAEGTEQVGLVEAKGQEVLESIPEDYSSLVTQANNTQFALENTKILPYNYIKYLSGGQIDTSTNKWADVGSRTKRFSVMPVKAGDTLSIKANGTLDAQVAMLKSYDGEQETGDDPVFSTATGWTAVKTITAGTTFSGTVPSDAVYVYCYLGTISGSTAPASLLVGGYDFTQNLYANISEIVGDVGDLKSAINGNVNPVMTTFAVPIFGKNRFDKNSNNIINGYYIDSSGKPIQPNAAYFTSDYIYVADCSQIHISGGSLNGTYIAFYDATKMLKTTVQGVSGSYNTYSVPSGCAFMRFSGKLTAIDNLQVEKGDAWTQYSSYTKPVISNKKDFLKVASNVLVVAKDGTGDFTTITAAFNYANTIQSANNPVTIFIMPGVYKESLNSGYHKYISFIGANKHDVIWRYDTGIYEQDPLKYANCGIVKGITFISTHDDTADFESTYTGTALTNYASYGLHLDTVDYNTSLNTNPFDTIIEDCIIICKQAPAIGCGMCPYQTLHIKNCELIMDIPSALLDAHDSAGKGCLLIHRAFITSETPTIAYISNNIIRANTGITWQLGKPSTSQAGVIFHLYNNVSWSSTNGKSNNSILGYSLGMAEIAEDCFGNNVTALNSQ
jgi:hypothetical protein